MSIRSGIQDFIKGLAVITGKTKLEGNRKLAVMAKFVDAQIPEYGVDNVRRQVIKSIENDMRKVAKEILKHDPDGLTAALIMKSQLVQDAMNTPDYMTMLHHLNMDDSHLWATAHFVVKEVKKNGKRR